jgi:hypothetical protein
MSNISNVKTISSFEDAIVRAATLGANMANSLATSIAIRELQAEEAHYTDTVGAPGYYEAARLGLMWHDLASVTVGEA